MIRKQKHSTHISMDCHLPNQVWKISIGNYLGVRVSNHVFYLCVNIIFTNASMVGPRADGLKCTSTLATGWVFLAMLQNP